MAAWKEYDYTAQWDGKDTVYRPILDIEVINPENGRTFKTKALVDSGTDNIALDFEIAEAIGIDLSTAPQGKLTGVGETVAYRSEVKISIKETGLEEEVPALFAKGLSFPVLLGQKFFFHLYDVRFEKRRNKFFLKKL